MTHNRDLLFSTNDGATLRLYKFDGGSVMVVEVVTAWKRAAAESDNIFRLQVDWRADNTANQLEMRVLVDGDDNPANAADVRTVTLPRTGLQSRNGGRSRSWLATGQRVVTRDESGYQGVRR